MQPTSSKTVKFRSHYLIFLIGIVLSACTGLGDGIISTPEDAAVQPRNAQEALLRAIRGTVEIQEQGGWSPVPAGKTAFLAAGTQIRTGNLSSVQIGFYDGSTATLEANSEISIDALNAQRDNQPREILLTQVSGNSNHSVAKNDATASRYEVRTTSGTGSAKGTEFSVWVLPNQDSLFSVDKGAVIVASVNVSITVNAGQMTTVIANGPPSPPSGFIKGEGLVSQMGDTWTVAGQPFKTHSSTLVIGEIHEGDIVHYEGHFLIDGSRVLDLVYTLQASPANHFRFTGIVEKIDMTSWSVSGQVLKVVPDTLIDNGIVAGDEVEVNGILLENGVFQASRISKINDPTSRLFEFSGIVEESDVSKWVISGITINVNDQTMIDEGIRLGKAVKVNGLIQNDGSWLAASILIAGSSDRTFEFTGSIQGMNPWKVADIAFETRAWTNIDANLKLTDLVRVKGFIQKDGIWVATEIKLAANTPESHFTLIGLVISKNPWIVSGISLSFTPQTVISPNITVGMLVRVEIDRLADGTWQALKIETLQSIGWTAGCIRVKANFVSIVGNEVQFQGWPLVTLPDNFQFDDRLVNGQAVLLEICFTPQNAIKLVSITVIVVTPSVTPPPMPDQNGKVLICHKPDNNIGGKTMLLPRSALSGHLGHGDTLGACP